MNILIVEDDPISATVIREGIVSWGHAAQVTTTGADALEKLGQTHFDLVLLDIYLPDCKGYDIIPQIKETAYDIGIVTMTGFNSRELELKVRQHGIFYYLIKPFSMVVLKEIVGHISNSKKEEIRNRRQHLSGAALQRDGLR